MTKIKGANYVGFSLDSYIYIYAYVCVVIHIYCIAGIINSF